MSRAGSVTVYPTQARAYKRNARLQSALIYLLMALVLVIILFPFVWMILTSFRNQIANTSPVPVWFFTPTLENYRNVIQRNDFLFFTWNSLVVATLSTLLGLVLGLPAAYSIARFKQNGLALAILIARLTPYITYLVPWYLAFRALGLIDTYVALTLTHLIVGMPLIIWIMISFFEDVPTELEEAAFVDGSSRLGVFFRIVLPLAAPGVVAASILAFIFSWNQFLFSLILSGPNTRPVPVAVFNFISYGQIDFGGLGAAAVLITLPVILLTLVIQRYIVSGLTMGAVKG
ncbi:carbohydrate ABC transporter permease [Truepera radiovictrix]|uniref:Binding-protein-dependent transport systems inner membrane component n=1 Tax=Truepera radiovictrix (strain DSM 17093 / CIP 108686 / LMG 22925 / RQ-24) TaxID=649638 RepID=D7CRW8_TRURR|nr:carbohydrate ABC transporter permease [Truepera radiovictrix]ADI15296.1 binding-protein-dependent transport systems inner membrane component [Truepera radiovictrix DSM 17093]WMT56153.1 carbohydrate ABC transporter permease [Truepera radiovictrix]